MYSSVLKLLISNLLIYNLVNCFDLRCEPFDSQEFNKFSEYSEFVDLIQPVNTKCLLSLQQSEKVITDDTAKTMIKHLKLLDSNISSITNEIFKDLPNLLWLNASSCKIVFIEESTFFSTKKLEIIDLSFNDLNQLSSNTFQQNENLKILDLSNNKILRYKAIKLANLQLLDLSSNQISKIQDGAFEFMTNLKILILSNNHFVQTGKEMFRNITNLKVLDLTSNQLRHVSNSGFTSLINLVQLKLNYNLIAIIESNSLAGLTNLKYFSYRSVGSFIFDFDVLQKNYKLEKLRIDSFVNIKDQVLMKSSLKNHNSLKDLSLTSMGFVEIEDNCFEHMKLLENLDLSGNDVKVITNSTFKGLENLKTLKLTSNTITFMDPEAFTDLKKLESLELHTNSLFRIESLAGLVNLKYFKNSFSSLIIIDPFDFKDLRNLETLKIENNDLTHITSDSFQGLVSVTELNASGSNIKNQKAVFKELTNLKTLVFYSSNALNLEYILEGLNKGLTSIYIDSNEISDMGSNLSFFKLLEFIRISHNQITHLTYKNFKGLVSLNDLDMVNNKISTIDKGTFKDLANLENLELSLNSLTKIEFGIFEGLLKLKRLVLKENQIEVIVEGSMKNMIQLEELNLEGNQLKQILPYNFYGLKNLTVLKLNKNPYESLSTAAFRGLSSVGSLNLDHCSLPIIIKGTFQGLKNLSDLFIYNSKVQTIEDCAFVGLDNITSLNLGRNNISVLEKYMFKGLSHLKELSLSESKVKSISPFAFEEMKNLESLNLEKNSIYGISASSFKGANSVKHLNLMSSGIQNLDPSSLQPLKNLTTINLYNVCFGKISPVLFKGLHDLNKVSLDICNGTEILYTFDDQMNVELNIDVSFVSKNQNISLSHLKNIANLTIVFAKNVDQNDESQENQENDDSNNETDPKSHKIFLSIPNSLIALKISEVNIQIIQENGKTKNKLSLLKNLLNLENLDFSESSLKTIENKQFDQLIKLKILNLRKNEFVFNNYQIFKNLVNLLIINLSENEMHVLSKKMFLKTSNLEELYLSQMEIELVEENSFDFLPNLKILDLSGNLISFLTDSHFKSNIKLESVLLNKNQITFLTSKIFTDLEHLAMIDLSENDCFVHYDAYEHFPSEVEYYLDFHIQCFGCTVGYLGEFGRGVDVIYGKNYTKGDQSKQFQSLKILCEPGYAFVKAENRDDTVTCGENGWDKDFPICTKLCPGIETLGYTTQSKCYVNEELVPCSRDQSPGTEAHLTCAVGYQLPENFTGSERMTCLEGGKWDSEPIQCKPICGRITSKSIPLIIAGQDTESVVNTPWQAAIFRQTANSYKLDCGGSILTKRIVLSAAHCFFIEDSQSWNPKENYKIVVGKYYRKFDANEAFSTQTFGIDEIRTVSGFNGFSGFYISDIAIIILNGLIDFQPHIIPICIDLNIKFGVDQIVNEKEIGVVAGWGNTKAGGIPSRILKSIELPVVDFQQCERESGDFKRFITPDKFCSGYRNGSGVCKGDSGGGLVFKQIVEDGVAAYYIKGIVSNGKLVIQSSQCDNFYTLFTNVLEYIPFIKEAVVEYP